MRERLTIQANVSGYQGEPVTILAVYSRATQVLSIIQAQDYTEARLGNIVIGTNSTAKDVDVPFNDEKIRESIQAYNELNGGKAYIDDDMIDRLAIDDEMQQHNPESVIDLIEYDLKGPVYKVVGDITNGQVCILAICSVAVKQNTYQNVSTEADKIMSALEMLDRGYAITI